ncbi:protein-disulfide isomerase [Lacibacter cauensis]|uniref:Protein-disulfide isomerase n=1 Tax=Lacibacter cauensis TaxID=510947 RepID=A0A562SFY0_9BACT|nr:thioredoxin domain-containing protein [Lacibacter cauensis]TWI80249.1 protein-disulfide isomerase [Lacibacter cauensis]
MAQKQAEIEIIPPKDIWVGNKKAPVKLVMYGDYESEACAKANEVVNQLLEKFEDTVQFNFRHFPLTRIHQRAQKAAEASVGAAQEGEVKFWDMHNTLFAHRRNLGTISLKGYAKDVGVTDKNFLTKLVDSVYGWSVRADLLEGADKGIKDVPFFYINGEPYSGPVNLSAFSKVIEPLTKQKKAASKTAVKKRA